SAWRLSQVDLGFRPQGVWTAKLDLGGGRYRMPANRVGFYDRLLAQVSALPGVAQAALGTNLPLNTGATMIVDLHAVGSDGAYFTYVTPDYFQTLGIAPLAGRDFAGSDRSGSPRVAIVSRSLAAALWPHANPVGKTLAMPANPGTSETLVIIGEVGDTHLQPGAAAAPMLYMPLAQIPDASVAMVVRTREAGVAMAPALRRAVAAVDADVPLAQVATMPELMRADLAEPRFRTVVLGLFAALALALSVAGLGGVVAYAATQRTHEIGVRMALGARTNAVARMVLGQGLSLAGVGMALGLGGALALARTLAHWLYGVGGSDPATLAAAAALLGLACAAACWWPARRAARMDPVVALRCE
ncbi:MAG: FtsX-like permease family protein, partial [Terriglobales bacterium]